MFCPHCGAERRLAEGYCTRCGEYMPDPEAPARVGTSRPEGKMKEMAIFSAINAVLALFSAIALYATHLGNADEARWTVFAAAACCTVIAVHQIVSFVFNMQLQGRLKRARESDARARAAEGAGATPAAVGAGPARALAGADASAFAGVRSVTESTTELLEPVPRRGGGGGRGRER